jgi:hypothetical protein
MGKIIYYGAIQNFIFTFLQNAMFALYYQVLKVKKMMIMKKMLKERRKKS